MNRLASPAELRASLMRWALFLIPAVVLLGWLSGSASGSGPDNSWFASLDKPSFLADTSYFSAVWIALFIMMGLGLAIVCSAWGARLRSAAITGFAVQFVLCLAWSPVFFIMHNIGASLVIMVALFVAALLTALLFWKVRPKAGLLLAPYLVWLLFLSVVNFQIFLANPDPFDADANNAVQRIEL